MTHKRSYAGHIDLIDGIASENPLASGIVQSLKAKTALKAVN